MSGSGDYYVKLSKSHHVYKFFKVDLTISVGVNFLNHKCYLWCLKLPSQNSKESLIMIMIKRTLSVYKFYQDIAWSSVIFSPKLAITFKTEKLSYGKGKQENLQCFWGIYSRQRVLSLRIWKSETITLYTGFVWGNGTCLSSKAEIWPLPSLS